MDNFFLRIFAGMFQFLEKIFFLEFLKKENTTMDIESKRLLECLECVLDIRSFFFIH